MEKTCILAIETSCDDTSLALAKNNKLIKECTLTSLNEHCKFGGIVPEVAARGHEDSIAKCLKKIISDTKANYKDITHIAYTSHPGLPGSLHIGKIFAKSLGSLLKIKLIPINHMYGHIFSFGINQQKITYPFLSLVVSGGHTTIYLVKSAINIKTLNQTTDDAVGETLDKIGRELGLEYPGGISIDKAFNKSKATFKMINHYPVEQPFSFSGVKTHILNYLNTQKMKNRQIDKVSIASSVLEWITDELIRKLTFYADKYKINTITIGGGVSANKCLRAKLNQKKWKVILPELSYCGDNASMIANYANLIINKHCLSDKK